MDTTTISLNPVGYVRSPLRTAQGSPLQPRNASHVVGTIELDPSLAEATRDLEGFSRIWVIYWFHRASPAGLLVTPYRDVHQRGVYATRVPARPNSIGISPVSLLKVEGHVLFIGDVDLLDGTPVLDIKPYVPQYDAYPSEQIGWLATAARLEQTRGDSRYEVATSTAATSPATPKAPTGVLRVAVASRDGKTVHQHFGKATAFQIFDIDAGVARFVETRANAPTCRNGADPSDDVPPAPPPAVPPSIADCCAVVVAAIGPGARARLENNHIRAFVAPDFIDAALARVASELAPS